MNEKKSIHTHTHTGLPAALANYKHSPDQQRPPGSAVDLLCVFMQLMILLFGEAAGSSRLLLMPLHLLPLTQLTAGEKKGGLAIIYHSESNQQLADF